MQTRFLKTSILISALTLSACGGGGGGGGGGLGSGVSLTDFANINASTNLNELTSDATVNGSSDTLSYSGFVNIGPDTGGATLVGFVGEMNVSVNFSSDAISGSAQNFGEYTATTTGNLPAVSGSLAINGSLTGSNDSGLGDGMSGTAVGTVGGYAFDMTFDGNVLGATRDGVAMYFDNTGDLGGGVGIAVR